jgi:hypothetical protein
LKSPESLRCQVFSGDFHAWGALARTDPRLLCVLATEQVPPPGVQKGTLAAFGRVAGMRPPGSAATAPPQSLISASVGRKPAGQNQAIKWVQLGPDHGQKKLCDFDKLCFQLKRDMGRSAPKSGNQSGLALLVTGDMNAPSRQMALVRLAYVRPGWWPGRDVPGRALLRSGC